ncbi:hypothetical protein SCMU_19410 [Sinomonas cyclohexanicum]|uniref:Uncharacterized protein n=1 Tax=Sinomonas cyclohexanicum TaxID=322009 RepID=A0ABM7PVH5_SINCY|nr:hypothetical protein [Corynebacterium cyclohexanicum]BCT76099.1 hypothetical protein SCMU_19410 [Corynebacterium cyclohexanicum]
MATVKVIIDASPGWTEARWTKNLAALLGPWGTLAAGRINGALEIRLPAAAPVAASALAPLADLDAQGFKVEYVLPDGVHGPEWVTALRAAGVSL